MTKLVSLGLFTLMIVGFLQGLSPNTGIVEVKASKEVFDFQSISLDDQIKLARLEKNMSQQELATRTQLTKYNIEAIEAGEAVPSREVLKRFETVLNTKLVSIR